MDCSPSLPKISSQTELSKHTAHQVQVQGQANLETFPFLDLPLEIRYMIYRYALVSNHVVRQKKNTPYLIMTPVGVSRALYTPAIQQPAAARPPRLPRVGTIRCGTNTRDILDYQMSILRVNHQLYQEALTIFQQENFWVLVRINKSGFGKQMKDLGFTVFPCANFTHIKNPVLSVNAQFHSPFIITQSDCFVVSIMHLDQLFRVLWTVAGTEQMMVQFQRFLPSSRRSPDTILLLRRFLHLIGPKWTFLVRGPRYNDMEISRMFRPSSSKEAIDLVLSATYARTEKTERYMEAGKWDKAVAMSQDSLYFYTDAQIIYGYHLMPSGGPYTAEERYEQFMEPKSLGLRLMIAFADIALHFRHYRRAVDFCRMGLISNPSNTASIRPAYKCWILTIRARAHAAQHMEQEAYLDFNSAAMWAPHIAALAQERDSYSRYLEIKRNLGPAAVEYKPDSTRFCPWVGTRESTFE